MRFQFIEKKLDISEALKEYTQKKLGKLEKYFKNEADAQVRFYLEGGRRMLEVTVSSEGLHYRSKIKEEDMYTAIDSSVAAIERQIHKNKTRLEKRLRQGAFEREIPVSAVDSAIDEEMEFPIVRTKKFDLKPMTTEEAILQMNLLGHEFFVFKNFARGGGFAVVYRRHDGGYGLIEEN